MNALNSIMLKLCGGVNCNECPFNKIDGMPGCLLAERIENLVSAEPELVNSLTEVDRKNDDLIRRQDAIDAIHCNITVTGRQNAELVAATIGTFADRIKALPSAEPKTGNWIPCSERLPELNQICIVTDETRRCAYEYGLHGETYDEENGWTYLGHRIVAWMPLPEPWRGE